MHHFRSRRKTKKRATFALENCQIVKASDFKISRLYGSKTHCLFIFTSDDRKLSYKYSYNEKRDQYSCLACLKKKKFVTARMFKDANGNDYLKLKDAPHICEPQEHVTEEVTIIESSNFEETVCRDVRGVERKCLFIYTSDDRRICYKYHYVEDRDVYLCSSCQNKKGKTWVIARVCQTDDGSSYVKLGDNPHLCEPQEYVRDELQRIEPSMFKVLSYTKHSLPKSRLLIFTTPNHESCYEYYWDNFSKQWHCSECRLVSKSQGFNRKTYAKIIQNKDGIEEYVKLGPAPHICEPRQFNPELYRSTDAIYQPNYELFEFTRRGEESKRLIVFASDDRKLCYEFYGSSTTPDKFTCSKCAIANFSLIVYLRNDQNGIECVSLAKKQHVCEPIKYEPGSYVDSGIIKKPNFKLVEPCKANSWKRRIFIFHPTNRKLSYKYGFNQEAKCFYCNVCRKQGKFVTAKLIENENEEPYLELNDIKHVCEPQKYKYLRR